jgi:hypothetical protein
LRQARSRFWLSSGPETPLAAVRNETFGWSGGHLRSARRYLQIRPYAAVVPRFRR